jgi:hypothetical protein
MNRDEDLKNLWAELNKPVYEADDKGDKEDAPKEAVELESLLSRLEDVVSRLEEALGKKEDADKADNADKADDSDSDDNADADAEEEDTKESYIPRRVRRPWRGR